MRRLLSLLLLVSSIAWADTTANLITNQPGIAGTGVWTGIGGYSQLNGTPPGQLWGCCTSYSGSAPFLDTSGSSNGQSGKIHWSYGQTTVAQVIAINQALAGVNAGVQINGYNWGYEVRNMNGGLGGQPAYNDVLTATTFMTNSGGTRILSDTRTYTGPSEWNWYGGTKSLATPLEIANAGTLGVEFTGSDAGSWNGYYGPQVRNVSLQLNYTAAPVDPCVANPQSNPSCPGYKTYYNMSDDGYAIVNLPFIFPFYGQLFTTSVMYTNGVVGFLDPNPGGFCCSGTDLNGQVLSPNSPWRYAIYALNTDLIPGANSTFYTEQTDAGTGIKYTWNRVNEIGTNNENTFSVNIKDSGYIGINYSQINLSANATPLIGIAGDISQGQYYQKHFGPAATMTATAGTAYTFSGTETTDVCAQNPLFSPNCPGYAQAYFNQQCSINALYDSTCPGYAVAYHAQQCSINSLYAVTCPGYAQAYYSQQCSLNPFYDSGCTGYTAAVEQCSANPLSHTYCPAYQTASAECSVNQLLYTYCPSYQTTLAACSTNSQSNTLCPNYSTTSTSSTATASTSEPAIDIKSNGTINTTVALVSDSTVNSVLTTKSDAADPTAVVKTTGGSDNRDIQPQQPTPAAAPTQQQTQAAQAEQKQTAAAVEAVVNTVEKRETASADTKKDTKETSGDSKEKTSSSDAKSDKKSDTNSQAQRREAVKKAATEKARELANDISRAATIEAQTASQAVVLGLMNYTPGFDSYNNAIVPDINARAMARQYNKDNVDNRSLLRQLNGASDRMHQDMIDQQYQLRR